MSQLGKRLISSAALIALSVSTIFMAPDWLFAIVIGLLVLTAFHEYLRLVEKKGIPVHYRFGLFFAALLHFSVYFHAESLILMLAVLAFFIFHFHPERLSQTLISTGMTVFGMIYVVWFCSHVLILRHLEYGSWWFFYILLLVKGGDTGAYFVGKKFGKIKLIAHVSPNKTVEGAVAGFITTLVLSLLSFTYLPQVSFGHLLTLGVCVSILSQLGDLGESLFKREVGVKDSGHVPGLGGILDVLDSLILSIPFVYYYVTLVLI